jgi:Flp pilus assembly protein TadD
LTENKMLKINATPRHPDQAIARGVRYAIAWAALLVLVWAAINSANTGMSRLLSEYGSATNSLAATRRALDFEPADPQAHYAHAVNLTDAGARDEAVSEFEQAVSLRPADYFLWQELGLAREDAGDSEGAAADLRRAINLAPDYSQPHWQLGNLLLRRNEPDAAFTEMRAATANDPELFKVMADLAWGVYDGDSKSVLLAIHPHTDDQRISLALFFVNHNQIEAGLNLVEASATIATNDRRTLVAALIAAGQFQAARRVWLTGRGVVEVDEDDLLDGGFEGSMTSGDQGFGWLPTQAPTVKVQLDPNDPQSGNRSLRLEYTGNFDSAAPVVSQLVLVSPRSRYLLNFSARTQDLVSAALPVVAIREGTGERQVITQSMALPTGTTGWRSFSIEFATSQASTVVVSIQRQACASKPCPIVGRAWFDSFLLKRL